MSIHEGKSGRAWRCAVHGVMLCLLACEGSALFTALPACMHGQHGWPA